MLVIYSRKQILTKKLASLKRKLLIINKHDKYITTPKFNKLTAENFAVRLAQAKLITKQILVLNCQVLIETLLQIKQNIYLLKIN